jgi:hypothetical protein
MNNIPGNQFPINSGVGASQPGVARCAVHPNAVATFCCSDCGKTFCETCRIDAEDGTMLCTDCMTRRIPPQAASSVESIPPYITPELARQMLEKSDQELLAMRASPADWTLEALAAAEAEVQKRNITIAPPDDSTPAPLRKAFQIRDGVMCAQHPQVKATQQCLYCGGYMCPTCDFAFPDEIHLCPTCASKSQDGLSPRRKKFVIWSFVLAAWTTIGMTCLVSGAFSGMANSKDDIAVLGYALLLFVLAPGITGLALGISAKHARLGNPPSIWIAITWNAILVASFVILDLIGLSK